MVAPAEPLWWRHTLTSRQTALLDTLEVRGEERAANPTVSDGPLERACLDFCISLLDHQLKGDIFESAIVGYLAVLGIDESNSRFYDAPTYTPKLSGFIKISQMLVLQKAVLAVGDADADSSLDALEDMRPRFMTLHNPTSFAWALSLRSFWKCIRDSITSLGYIQWSDDGQTVFYRNLDLSIGAFQAFVHTQLRRTQDLLQDLFLLGTDDRREDVVPALALHRLRDNPTIIKHGWNFLHDERNRDVLRASSDWLLQRVLRNEWLRDVFCSLNAESEVVWNSQALENYQKQVDTFLEGLLLLVHVTSGQPARGTKITGLRHSNNMYHRNIFIEDGLVTIVTSYHKGYN